MSTEAARRRPARRDEAAERPTSSSVSDAPARGDEKQCTETSSGYEKYMQEKRDLLEWHRKDKLVIEGESLEEEKEQFIDVMLNRVIFCLTIFMIYGNLRASIISGSLAIFSTFVDASMDLATSTIMGICMHYAQSSDQRYPRGRERLEMVGVIVCSVIMAVANVLLFVQTVDAVVRGQVDPHLTSETNKLILSACLFKGICLFVCLQRGTFRSTCLALDLRNDIITCLVSIGCAYIGDVYWNYADAVGAMAVSAFITWSWIQNTLQHIPLLVGITANKEHTSRILKVVVDHDDRIQFVDHFMMYHIGEKAIVELHIVLDEHLPLRVTHDISHNLEEKLNRLEFVARTFVHCDYVCDGDH